MLGLGGIMSLPRRTCRMWDQTRYIRMAHSPKAETVEVVMQRGGMRVDVNAIFFFVCCGSAGSGSMTKSLNVPPI